MGAGSQIPQRPPTALLADDVSADSPPAVPPHLQQSLPRMHAVDSDVDLPDLHADVEDSSAAPDDDFEVVAISVVSIAGNVCASWSGPAKSAVAVVTRDVAEQMGASVAKVALIWRDQVLHGGLSLQDQGVEDGADVQVVVKCDAKIRIRTKRYAIPHYWGLDEDNRVFHVSFDNDDELDMIAQVVVKIETWLVQPALNGKVGAFSLERANCRGHFLFVQRDSPQELLAGGRTSLNGPLLFAVDAAKGWGDTDAASFTATSAQEGNAVLISPCSHPDLAISQDWARLHPRNRGDPAVILAEPFDGDQDQELSVEDALDILCGP